MTTKKVAWKTCLKELLWFIHGKTDNKLLQDEKGMPTQDNFGSDIEGTSITQERWHEGNAQDFLLDNAGLSGINDFAFNWNQNGEWINYQNFGQLYGIDPQYANMNGYFNLNEREGKMSFSSEKFF